MHRTRTHQFRQLGSLRLFRGSPGTPQACSSPSHQQWVVPSSTTATLLELSEENESNGEQQVGGGAVVARNNGEFFLLQERTPDTFGCVQFPSEILNGESRLTNNWFLFVFLLAVGFSPFITMYLIIDSFKSSCYAMFVMHFICMSLIPFLVTKFLFRDGYYYRCFAKTQILQQWRKQLGWALILGAYGGLASAALHDHVFAKIGTESGDYNIMRIHQNLAKGTDLITPFWAFAGIWFTFMNPLFEEFFWRVFLTKELGGRYFPAATTAPNNGGERPTSPSNRTQGGFCQLFPGDQLLLLDKRSTTATTTPEVRSPSPKSLERQQQRVVTPALLCEDQPVSFMGHLLVNLMYTSYHVVVVQRATDWPFAFVACSSLLIYGLMFSWLRTRQRSAAYIRLIIETQQQVWVPLRLHGPRWDRYGCNIQLLS